MRIPDPMIGGGATAFTGLTDVSPQSYAGYNRYGVGVNSGATGLTFIRRPYYITEWGAKGDAIVTRNGSCMAGNTMITIGSALFKASDVGKTIVLTGAGAGGAQLTTTIASYVDTMHVNLTTAPSTTVTGNMPVSWGYENTSAIQTCFNDVDTLGGGMIVIPEGMFLTTGTLNFGPPSNDGYFMWYGKPKALVGESLGVSFVLNPHLQEYVNVAYAPMLLITSQSASFLNIYGSNSRISGLAFYHPNQVKCSVATAPVVYPYTITVNNPSTITECAFINSYDAINGAVGECRYINNTFGAFHNAITIDNAVDFTFIDGVHVVQAYNFIEGVGGTQSIDNWVNSNRYAIIVKRCDSLIMNNVGIFNGYCGMYFTEGAMGVSYGVANNINLDLPAYGIIYEAGNQYGPGWGFSNLQNGAATNGIWFKTPTNGARTRMMTWAGGGTWNGGATDRIDTGLSYTLKVRGVAGRTDIG